ncbi:hypothetical protein EIP86_011104 [Pleurotus ostreatoroseus]|nr:hypothetical protein EIP86_006245 [Pleurotus ostreatoroseus]KAF7799862.1 hypothetical protein EIP86_011104 [Pleurotus ostreatoroseus]
MDAPPPSPASSARELPAGDARSTSPDPAVVYAAWRARQERLEDEYPRSPHLLWRPAFDPDPLAKLLTPKQPPPNSLPVVVSTRGAVPGHAEKVEWRLLAKPSRRIRRGLDVAICGLAGTYLGPTRTVGDVLSTDKNWITFLLKATDEDSSVHTLTVPVENAVVPLFVRLLRFVLARWLPDEHPGISIPLLPFTEAGCV